MGEGEGGEARYRAFLSYSHRDAGPAGRLHRRLESYRIPKRLAGRETARGRVPARLWPIFRDREELPAASDLSQTVREALAESEALIVLCSPDAAASHWVAEEIRVFREIHPGRPILAAILDGNPPDCFPAQLRAFGRDGTWHEPLATDLRREGDGGRLGLLKLVAGITGLGLDDLVQRDAARRVRRISMVSVIAIVATLVMAALAWFAIDARREADRQRVEAEGHIEFMLTKLRDQLRRVGSSEVMSVVDRQALDYYARQQIAALGPDSLERRARVLIAMGEDESTRGHLDRAAEAFREAYRTTEALLAQAPRNPERLFVHAQSEYWMGFVHKERGDNQAALASFRRYLALAERMNRAAPDDPRYVGELAYAQSNLGSIAADGFHRQAEARQHFASSLRWFERAAALEPANRTWRAEAADAHAWIAGTWTAEGRQTEARRERLAEHGIKTRLAAEDPGNWAYRYATVISARSLARIDMELRDHVSAERLLRQCRATMAILLARDADNLIWRDQATMIEADFARLFAETGRPAQARAALGRARAMLGGSAQRSSAPAPMRDRIREAVERLAVQIGAA
jgi:tetratricopeptide (TPR) repeat protein